MATNRKAVKQYIMDRINETDFSQYTTSDGRPLNPQTDNDRLLCAMAICRAEVGHIEPREGVQAMVEHWFSGLCSVVSLPYVSANIIALAIEWNSIPADYTDRQAKKILANWWSHMAAQFLQMVNKAAKLSDK